MLELVVFEANALLAQQIAEELLSLGRGLAQDPQLEFLVEEADQGRLALLIWAPESGQGITSAVLTEQLTVHTDIAVGRELVWLAFEPILDLGLSRLRSPVANLIIRDIEPVEVETFLPSLQVQMKRVAARPGCLGTFLGRLQGSPSKLLGITRWADTASLQEYLRWSGAHEFKPVVEPITRDTPLRFLGLQAANNA